MKLRQMRENIRRERSRQITLTCLAVLMTLFYGVFLIEGLLGIPPMLPQH